MRLQAVRVTVSDEGASIGRHDTHQFIVINHRPVLHRTQLLPYAMKRLAGSGAKQVVDTAVKHIILAFPGRTQTARKVVQLEDLRVVTVQLGITARGQSGNAGTDDDDTLFWHGHPFWRGSKKGVCWR